MSKPSEIFRGCNPWLKIKYLCQVVFKPVQAMPQPTQLFQLSHHQLHCLVIWIVPPLVWPLDVESTSFPRLSHHRLSLSLIGLGKLAACQALLVLRRIVVLRQLISLPKCSSAFERVYLDGVNALNPALGVLLLEHNERSPILVKC